MNLDSILAPIEESVLLDVARSALGNSSIANAGQVSVTPLTGAHNDKRTIAIVRVTGNASASDSVTLSPWSAVLKVTDASIFSGTANAWNFPETEEQIYKLHVFEDLTLPFRAARCYAFTETLEGLSYLWLEDLTEAPQPPWSLEQYAATAYNLGRFNGYHGEGTELSASLSLPQHNFANRWEAADLISRIKRLEGHAKSPVIQAIFTAEQLASIFGAADAIDNFIKTAASLPTAIAHGDCHARNLFPMEDHTVAIDWSGISNEPIGADIGVLLGSGLG